MNLPPLVALRDELHSAPIENPRETAFNALADFLRTAKVAKGARIAVTAGSRGIADIVPVLAGTVAALRSAGLDPFVIPAMGSHGGGTAQGQTAMLAHLGVTEASIGAPINASMEVVPIGKTARGLEVVCDALAAAADGIVVVARVKPHTDFTGTIESGLLKMSAIGLGKASGAKAYHAAFAQSGYEAIIREVFAVHLQRSPLLAGVAIVENNAERTQSIDVIAPQDIISREESLLRIARAAMATLPFDELDLLVVDEMGKNISGTGMDTNVTGRAVDGKSQKTPSPRVRQLFVRELTEASNGNATGIGLADFCTKRLADAIDWPATYLNCLTAAQPAGARLPVVCARDEDGIRHALVAAGVDDPRHARIARIRSTLHLETIFASKEAVVGMRDRARYRAGEPFDALNSDAQGMLQPLPA